MRILHILLFLCLGLSVFAQTPGAIKSNKVASTESADALMDEWVSNWNQDKTTYIENSFDADAIILLGADTPLRGKAAISKNFVRHELPIVSNLVVKSLDSGISGDLAYQTGTYTNRIDKPEEGGKPYTQTGRYTFVWKRQAGNEFKLKSLLIDPDPAPEP